MIRAKSKVFWEGVSAGPTKIVNKWRNLSGEIRQMGHWQLVGAYWLSSGVAGVSIGRPCCVAVTAEELAQAQSTVPVSPAASTAWLIEGSASIACRSIGAPVRNR